MNTAVSRCALPQGGVRLFVAAQFGQSLANSSRAWRSASAGTADCAAANAFQNSAGGVGVSTRSTFVARRASAAGSGGGHGVAVNPSAAGWLIAKPLALSSDTAISHAPATRGTRRTSRRFTHPRRSIVSGRPGAAARKTAVPSWRTARELDCRDRLRTARTRAPLARRVSAASSRTLSAPSGSALPTSSAIARYSLQARHVLIDHHQRRVREPFGRDERVELAVLERQVEEIRRVVGIRRPGGGLRGQRVRETRRRIGSPARLCLARRPVAPARSRAARMTTSPPLRRDRSANSTSSSRRARRTRRGASCRCAWCRSRPSNGPPSPRLSRCASVR